MLEQNLTQILRFREAEILSIRYQKKSVILKVEKTSKMEICPKCANMCQNTYDHRNITVKDEPLGNRQVLIEINKRRFWCKTCQKAFVEPVAGIKKGHKTTERFKRAILKACDTYVSLKQVQVEFKISAGYVFKVFYQQLELQRRMNHQYPWPSTIGIDEHSFRRTKGYVEFATVFIDYKNSRIFELTDGKSEEVIAEQTKTISGPENVRRVVMDMCLAFKNFVKNNFPNAIITIDKFHIFLLISKPFSRCRREKVGHLKSTPKARLLFKPEHKLEHEQKMAVNEMIQYKGNENLKEYYNIYQALHRFYRIKGYRRAKLALEKLISRAANCPIKALNTVAETLTQWKQEILNYFTTRLTNGKTEGFNNLAKTLQRRAFGYKEFENYRLRLLNACG